MLYETGLPSSIRAMRTSTREKGWLKKQQMNEHLQSHTLGPHCWGGFPCMTVHIIWISISISLFCKVHVLISKGCWNKLPQTWWLKVTKNYPPLVLETRRPKARCCRAAVPPKAPGKNPFLASSSFWWLQAFLDSCHITDISASIFTWTSALCACFIPFCLAHMRTFVFGPTWTIQGNLLISRSLT